MSIQKGHPTRDAVLINSSDCSRGAMPGFRPNISIPQKSDQNTRGTLALIRIGINSCPNIFRVLLITVRIAKDGRGAPSMRAMKPPHRLDIHQLVNASGGLHASTMSLVGVY
jgi:hypothetical protein